MKQKILYLHGLGSSGQSSTVQKLLAQGLDVIAPSYRPEYYHESLSALSLVLQENQVSLIVGTSMGGYYALKLAEITQLPVLVVNPCFEPATILAHYCQTPAMNYVTHEPIPFDQAMLTAFEEINALNLQSPRIIIGRKDDVIPASYQQAFCRQRGWAFIETDWGHRVEDPMLLASFIVQVGV